MLERSERVNSGMYIQLHNAARAMSALGHHQPLSIHSGEWPVSGVFRPLRDAEKPDLKGNYHPTASVEQGGRRALL
jgi:hypothetical protein